MANKYIHKENYSRPDKRFKNIHTQAKSNKGKKSK